MARAGITYHDVAHAATALNNQGKNPTVDSVREALGTGSKSTIAPLLKRWKHQQAEGIAEDQTGLPAEIIAAVKGVFDAMQTRAQAEIDAIRAQAKDEQQQAVQVIREAQVRAESAESQSQALQAEVRALTEKHSGVSAALAATEKNLEKTQAQNEALEHRLADRQQDLQQLNAQLDRAQANLEHYRETVRQQREQERADYEQRLNSADQRIRQLEQECRRWQTAHQETQVENTGLAREREALTKQHTALEADIRALKQTLDDTSRSLTEAEARNEVLTHTQADLKTQLEAHAQRGIAIEKDLAVSQDRVKALTAELKTTQDRLQYVGQDNAVLLQEKANLAGQLKQLQGRL